MWPLYAADALMFLTVFIVALPTIKYGDPMSAAQTLLCCLLVLGSMVLMLVPFWLESKKPAEAEKPEGEDDAKQNFDIIFEDLASLRLMLADTEERIDGIAEKVDALPEDSAEKLAAFESAMAGFSESLKTKLREINESIDSNAMAITSCESADKEIRESVSKISAEVSGGKSSFEKAFKELEIKIDDIEAKVGHLADSAEKDDGAPAFAPAFGSMISKAFSGAENSKGSVSKFVALNKNFETVISEDGDIFGKEDPTAPNVIPGRAGNVNIPDSMSAATECVPVSKASDGECVLNAAAPAADKPAPISNNFDTVISEDGDVFGKEDPTAPDVIPGRTGDVEIPDDMGAATECVPASEASGGECVLNEVKDDGLDDFENSLKDVPSASEDDTAEETPPEPKEFFKEPDEENKGEKDDPDFFESAGSEESPAESADLNSNEDGRGAEDAAKETAALVDEILPDPQSTFLLDNVPESKRRKPGKKDTAITVNALIGIGNKPYLRGSGAGLSPSEGLPMEYVEIGKWRYVLPEISAPVEFRVLKNDKENSDGDETFTIKPGEKLELNLSFPLE